MDSSHDDGYIENRTFDEIEVGDEAFIEKRLTMDDIKLFAIMSGDVNPSHVDDDFARSTRFQEVIAHGMWGGALISTVLGTKLPGPGTVYLGQTLTFRAPVNLGDQLRVWVRVTAKDEQHKQLTLDCGCDNQKGQAVIEGEARVLAPTRKVRRPRTVMPQVRLSERGRLHEILTAADHPAPITMAVVHPVDHESLLGALAAAEHGLIVPLLVGPADKIRAVADAAQMSLEGIELVDVPHSHAAAAKAVALVREGRAESLMKGALHTDELMHEVFKRESGLRTERCISHVMAFDVPTYPRPLFITDAAINIYPTLEHKRNIIQNAIELAHALGNENPKVAILSAVETINPKITSTLDAAALCKMAERGQITGGTLDGPLAYDNAVSEAAAEAKHIVSPVAGRADILVAPDLEAANMLMKQLTYLADATGAGLVLGARVPIVLTSRADEAITRMASCALALLLADYRRRNRGSPPRRTPDMGDILVINSGSSSLKFALYAGTDSDAGLDALPLRYRGQVSGLGGGAPAARLTDADGNAVTAAALAELPASLDHHSALTRLLDWIADSPELDDIGVVGHRVVHGGQRHRAPVVLDAALTAELDALSSLAPLHQPYGLEPVRLLAELRPDVVQVACFDTAFHTTQPPVAQRFALPRTLTDKGLIRYGFHGLSFDYISRVLPRHLDGAPGGRVIVAHLGNGASLCAIRDGESVAATTGFTALEGLPMGTRCGSLDPGLVLHLLSKEGMSVDAVTELLYKRSGLLGVSGISHDMRRLLASDAPEAKEAIELFVYRIAREIGSLVAALGGLDHLVFTAGIGEHAAPVRRAVCRACDWLGVRLDDAANARHGSHIAAPNSRVGVWVIPTDEERMIAWHAARLVRAR